MNRFEKVSLREYACSTEVAVLAEVEEEYNQIILPRLGTQRSAGHDFFAPCDVIIPPHAIIKVYTGIKCELDDDKVLFLFPRSSLGIKKGITLRNTVGVIDADYFNNPSNEGHIIAVLENNTDITQSINKGEAFIQGVIVSFYRAEGAQSETERTGGIGSTNG